MSVLDNQVVALAHAEETAEFSCDGLPGMFTTHPQSLCVLALGLVRSIDLNARLFHVLTRLNQSDLGGRKINVFVKAPFDLVLPSPPVYPCSSCYSILGHASFDSLLCPGIIHSGNQRKVNQSSA